PLQQLLGQKVRVTLACRQGHQLLAGRVGMAGRDFLELKVGRRLILIPYRSLCSIRRKVGGKRPAPQEHRQALLNIDPSLRRRLILRFGEVVSADGALMNLFFGLPLRLKMKDFVGRGVVVATVRTGTVPVLHGVLEAVGEEALQLNAARRTERVSFDDICFVRI
ncbi:MAG: hypothetical protein AB1609_22880, partial [Bacillota bacterium]